MDEFLADAIGSAIAMKMGGMVEGVIRSTELRPNEKLSNHFSPGHCHWPITEQPDLFTLLGGEPCGVRLSDSCLMHPIKSVSGIIGIGTRVERVLNECMLCPMVNCFRRNTDPNAHFHH